MYTNYPGIKYRLKIRMNFLAIIIGRKHLSLGQIFPKSKREGLRLIWLCQITPSFLDESAQKKSGTVSQLFEASDVSSFIEGTSELNEITEFVCQLLVAGPRFGLLQLLLRILVSSLQRLCFFIPGILHWRAGSHFKNV